MRTVGVEEELLLVDARTGAPRAIAGGLMEQGSPEGAGNPGQGHSDPARSGAGQSGAEQPDTDQSDTEQSGTDQLGTDQSGTVAGELQQQQLEIDTAPTTDLAELEQRLRRWRQKADELAKTQGARTVALATSPVAAEAALTPTSRYRAMAEHFGLTTSEQLTCGLHVHVEVGSPAEGVAVLDRIRVWLPVLLAISANSPYWQGRDTGYASFRSQAWHRFPSAGPTDRFETPAHYAARTEALVASGVLLDRAMIYYDARLSEKYPTVEIRVADVCLRAADTVFLAGLCRGLVESAAREAERGVPAPDVATEFVRLATWRAGRSALSSELLDPLSSRPRPAVEVVEALLSYVDSAVGDAGDGEQIAASWARLRDHGTGADAQRAWAVEHGQSGAVLRAVEESLA